MKNLLTIEGQAWLQAQQNNVDIDPQHKVTIADKQLSAELITPVYDTANCSAMVASFNGDTGMGGTVELALRIMTKQGTSQWFSYGQWGIKHGFNGSVSNQRDHLANMQIDRLIIAPDVVVTGVQMKVTLRRVHIIDPAPTLTRVMLTTTKTNVDYQYDYIPEIDYTVPVQSQMVVPEVGRVICSPTALAMVMSYYGNAIDVIDVANHVYDNTANTYGNWTYNVAYAAEQGYRAYVYYCQNRRELFDILAEGYPVIASIRTQSRDQLRGAPQAYPSGHLVIVRGSTNTPDGAKLIVNDPAGQSAQQVINQYYVEDFMQVWRGIIYVIVET